MTTSTCSTVSAEDIKRFTERMAQELGLTELLHAESWANPGMHDLPVPEKIVGLRNGQIRMRNDKRGF